ncbi:MAG: LbtU family siderophore porin [Planctomycetes bacterium]|nr:LbtU family siderophore porin [Planctomycetota bacterium]
MILKHKSYSLPKLLTRMTLAASVISPFHQAIANEGIQLMDGVSMGVLVEAEAAIEKHSKEADTSDITLATLEVSFAAQLSEFLKADLAFLYEEDDTEEFTVDVGTLTLGGTESFPYYLAIGKTYLPFGQYNSNFVSDPLTLELGESNQSLAAIGWTNDQIDLQVGLFNGDVDAQAANDEGGKIDDFFASFTYEVNSIFSLGLSYVSDMGETDSLQDTVNEMITSLAYDDPAGIGVNLNLSYEKFDLIAEHLTAVDDFNAGTLTAEEAKPEATNLEVAYHQSEALTFAAKYERSEDVPEQPTSQYGIASSHSCGDHLSFGLEYLYGKYENDNTRSLVTLQIAVEY